MSWNYRVYKRESPIFGEEPTYDIVEAFYNDDGSLRSITVDGVAPMGDSPEDLAQSLRWMLKAFDKPILDSSVKYNDEDENDTE